MKYKKLFGIFSTTLLPITMIATLSTKCKNTEKEDERVKLIEKLGIKIADTALKQTKTSVNSFVNDIKNAKNWEEALSVLKKYNIKYDVSDAPAKAKYEISASTHGHDDEGIIHLDITRTIGSESKTERFEIVGFQKNPILENFTIGNYKINTKIKNSNLTIENVLAQIKEAQKLGFDQLLKKMDELLGIQKINQSDNDSQFEFNFDKIEKLIDSGQIHFKEIYTYKKGSESSKVKLNFEFQIWNMKKE